MELGQPHHIEAPALGSIDLREGFLKSLSLAAAGKGRKLVEHAEFHGAFLLLAPRLAEQWTKDSASHRGPAIMARMTKSREAG